MLQIGVVNESQFTIKLTSQKLIAREDVLNKSNFDKFKNTISTCTYLKTVFQKRACMQLLWKSMTRLK